MSEPPAGPVRRRAGETWDTARTWWGPPRHRSRGPCTVDGPREHSEFDVTRSPAYRELLRGGASGADAGLAAVWEFVRAREDLRTPGAAVHYLGHVCREHGNQALMAALRAPDDDEQCLDFDSCVSAAEHIWQSVWYSV